MKNTDANARITLGDLDPRFFTQQADGTISFNTDGDIPSDRTIRYTPGTDAFAGAVELYDASADTVIWSIPAVNAYNSQGKYLSTELNFGLADLV